MTAQNHAYSTTDPAALAAHRDALAARAEYAAWIRVAAKQLGGATRGRASIKGFGGPEELIGLDADGSGTVPHGWTLLTGDLLKPLTRGEGASAAKRWLRERQPTPNADPIYALKAHGLAYQSREWVGAGTFKTYLPVLFEHDGELWACYRGKPDGDFPGDPANITWTPRTLAEFETAKGEAWALAAQPELATEPKRTCKYRDAPADWQPGVTRVRIADFIDGQPRTGTFVGNSDRTTDPGMRRWLGVLIRFDGEDTPVDVDPAELVVINGAAAPDNDRSADLIA